MEVSSHRPTLTQTPNLVATSAGFMGSMVSLHNMRFLSGDNSSTGRSGGGSQGAAISEAQKRQLFTQTGI